MDFRGTPLVIEPWPDEFSRNAGLLLHRLDQKIELTRAVVQALEDSPTPTVRECNWPRLRPRHFGNNLATTLGM
jgi:hypothetical protein